MNNNDSIDNNVKIVKKRGRKPKDKQEVSTKVIEEYVNTNMVLHIPLYDSIQAEQEIVDDSLIPFDKNMMYMIEFNKDNINETSVPLNNPMQNYQSNTRKLYEINNMFDDSLKENDYCCFWCTEKFSSMAIGLPYKLLKNTNKNSEFQYKYKYMVYGYFCSFGCCASYNFSLKDSMMNERFTLLNNLHEDIFGNINPIVLAPPREMLKKFGGYLTIDEFRNRSNSQIQYQLLIPPLMSMRCQIEEFYGNLYKKNDVSTSSVIHLDDERINRAQTNIEKLKLKRSTSIHNSKNNIENRMGIKIIN